MRPFHDGGWCWRPVRGFHRQRRADRASVTSPFACSAGTCTYTASVSAVLTDFQVDFAIPQFGSAVLPFAAVLTGMSVNVSGLYTTSGTVTAGPTGASSVVVTTDNITTTMTAGTTAVGSFTGLGGNSPSSANFQVSNTADKIANQFWHPAGQCQRRRELHQGASEPRELHRS
jgi:hypothetical protein